MVDSGRDPFARVTDTVCETLRPSHPSNPQESWIPAETEYMDHYLSSWRDIKRPNEGFASLPQKMCPPHPLASPRIPPHPRSARSRREVRRQHRVLVRARARARAVPHPALSLSRSIPSCGTGHAGTATSATASWRSRTARCPGRTPSSCWRRWRPWTAWATTARRSRAGRCPRCASWGSRRASAHARTHAPAVARFASRRERLRTRGPAGSHSCRAVGGGERRRFALIGGNAKGQGMELLLRRGE